MTVPQSAGRVRLLTGPVASGKTRFLLERAREVLAGRGRVLWIALPQQRGDVYRRATRAGALLGLEVLSSQQLYYRLLASALKLRPLVVGTARVALVGEALLALEERLPSPGEASLFAQGIAESKRYGLGPEGVPASDAESARFARVFAQYEAIKGARWDYDDFRSEALAFLRAGGEAKLGVDLVVVDGFRELSPLEFGVYQALGAQLPVWLGLPETPLGYACEPERQLAARAAPPREVYCAPNPVAEARWVLRSLKRDLAEGYAPLELAVVVPETRARAFAALADEYGVPLMDEFPRSLADTAGGRLLLDLIELPDAPSASKLLALPELAPLAREAMARGVSGSDALTRLAGELGLQASWQGWLARLAKPEGGEAWALELVRSVPDVEGSPYREAFLARAQEAQRLASGADFRRWWAALLRATRVYHRPRGGVALTSATLASGRRWRRVYLMHATKGAYGASEREDYFVIEDARVAAAQTSSERALPRRFADRDRLLFAELLSRGQEQVVSYPDADQAGPLRCEPALVRGAQALPTVPAGSRLELAPSGSYRASLSPLGLGSAHVERLRHYERCAFRFWAENRLREEARPEPWWRALVADLRELRSVNPTRLGALGARYPQAEGWLGAHSAALCALSYGVRLPETGAPQARLDAAGRDGDRVSLYLFAEPGRAETPEEAKALLEERWAEWWAAHHLISRWGRQIRGVRLLVWPLLGAPQDALSGEIRYLWRRLESREARVREAHARFVRGDVSAKPGFGCRSCGVKDLCREARP